MAIRKCRAERPWGGEANRDATPISGGSIPERSPFMGQEFAQEGRLEGGKSGMGSLERKIIWKCGSSLSVN
ncbi:MAG: hypothetical protein ACLR6B_01025 [Blautia sp.]